MRAVLDEAEVLLGEAARAGEVADVEVEVVETHRRNPPVGVERISRRLADLTPVEGFAAETGAGMVLQLAAWAGVPVSTTHTITGSIFGVGSVHSLRRVRWMLGAKIVYAWVLTLPCTFALAWLTSVIIHMGR